MNKKAALFSIYCITNSNPFPIEKPSKKLAVYTKDTGNTITVKKTARTI